MPLAKIKTEEERTRLDAIFAELEAAERGETTKPVDTLTQEQRDEDNRRARINRLASLATREFIGNVKTNIGNGAFTTRWEKILSQFIMDRIAPMNEELNTLRNFATAVDIRLQKAEKAAKDQDNHHYYKIFAEGVKEMLEKL